METARAHAYLSRPPQVRPEARLSPLLVLANSYKLGKRCVAGLDWSGGVAGGWVRPVSGAGDASGIDLPELVSGSDLLPGDIVGVPLAGAVPAFHQTENRLLVPGRNWRPLGRLRWRELAELTDKPAYPLWADGGHVGNDRVPANQIHPSDGSLRFIRADHDWARYERHFLALLGTCRVTSRLVPDDFREACLLCSEPAPDRCHRRPAAEHLAAAWTMAIPAATPRCAGC